MEAHLIFQVARLVPIPAYVFQQRQAYEGLVDLNWLLFHHIGNGPPKESETHADDHHR